jgi:hypothetical protein
VISAEPPARSSWAKDTSSSAFATHEDLGALGECDLAGLPVIVAGVELGEVLDVPGDPERVRVVVGDLFDLQFRGGRGGAGRDLSPVPHPDELGREPARRFEVLAVALGHLGIVEVEAPVLEARQGLVGECAQLLGPELRRLLDPDQVQVPVVGVAARPHDRAVRPGLDRVADRVLGVVLPIEHTPDQLLPIFPLGRHRAPRLEAP